MKLHGNLKVLSKCLKKMLINRIFRDRTIAMSYSLSSNEMNKRVFTLAWGVEPWGLKPSRGLKYLASLKSGPTPATEEFADMTTTPRRWRHFNHQDLHVLGEG